MGITAAGALNGQRSFEARCRTAAHCRPSLHRHRKANGSWFAGLTWWGIFDVALLQCCSLSASWGFVTVCCCGSSGWIRSIRVALWLDVSVGTCQSVGRRMPVGCLRLDNSAARSVAAGNCVVSVLADSVVWFCWQ